MSAFTRDELLRALAPRRARAVGSLVDVRGVSTDSRAIAAGSLFVALSGDRFDGHAFVEAAAARGAAAALVSREVPSAIPLVVVDDTLTALQDLATFHLARVPARRLALTGSNGKTSTKELARAALAGGLGDDRVSATRGNLNNHIGVPLTAFDVDVRHAAVVFEMGMNHLGEIARLAEIVHPSVGLVTNIGSAHAANVGGIEGVARAKGELFDALGDAGTAIVNVDDARCVAAARGHTGPRLTFALDAPADVRARVVGASQEGLALEIAHAGVTREGRIPLVGRHHARNAAGAVAMALAAGVSLDDAVRGLARAKESGGRLVWKTRGDGAVVLDDTYNANPDSLRAALTTLRELAEERRTVACIGDMLELDEPERSHDEIGRFVASLGLDRLFTAGPLARRVHDAAVAHGMAASACVHAADSAALGVVARGVVGERDIVLVKGSRGARMERVVTALLEGGA